MSNKIISKFVVLLICLLGASFISAEVKEGEYRGAKTATHPSWFKESFLDLEEDIADAAENNKRLVVYFWQPGCPYCSQLWEDNFSKKDILNKFRDNFEIVALNLWGDRDVVSVAGNNYTEKSFAEALQIKYTPTLLFFNEQRKVVHQLNGYVPPEDFMTSLEYVSGKNDTNQSFAEFSVARAGNKKVGKLNHEDFFMKDGFDLSRRNSQSKEYLAVFFESTNCKNCDLLHNKILQDDTTRKLVQQFDSVQLDRYAETPLTTPKGVKTTAKEWATRLNISYLPATVFFDSTGKEVMRIDAQMRTFHTQSVYDFVLSGAYKTEKNFQRWISVRADKIRAKGVDVDIWAY